MTPRRLFLGTNQGQWPNAQSMLVIMNSHPRAIDVYVPAMPALTN